MGLKLDIWKPIKIFGTLLLSGSWPTPLELSVVQGPLPTEDEGEAGGGDVGPEKQFHRSWSSLHPWCGEWIHWTELS